MTKKQKKAFAANIIRAGRDAAAVRERMSIPMAWTYADIWDAYRAPSAAKVRAWERCKQLCKDLGGDDLRIIGKSSMAFSVAFRFHHPETGEPCGAWITKDRDRFATI